MTSEEFSAVCKLQNELKEAHEKLEASINREQALAAHLKRIKNAETMKYRKKPVEIEAVRFYDGMDISEPEWLSEAISSNTVITHGIGKFARGEVYATIKTLEGDYRCNEGDYIIRGIKGELYPCKPDIFEATYKAVE